MATTPVFSFTQPTVGGDNGVWGGFLNTDWANLDTYLGVLRQAAKVLTIGATTTLDFNAPASVFKLTVSQATTIAIANTPANVTAQQLATQFTLVLVNGGAFTVTWPGSFVWSGGQPPLLQTSGTDVIVGWSPDNGTTWYTAGLMTSTTNVKPVLALTPVNGQTSSTVEVSIATVTVPAGKLAAVGDRVRIIAHYDLPSNTGGATIVYVKFGATYVVTRGLAGGGIADSASLVIDVIRTGSASQYALAVNTRLASTAVDVQRSTPGEALSGAVVIDFRGNVGIGTSTLFLRVGSVEVITG